MAYVLAIGDRAYSSWSLRGWLPFAKFGIPVTVRLCRLYAAEFPAMLGEGFGAARTVPALRIEEAGAPAFALWDSLAVAETLAERHPGLGLWPEPPAAWAMARALAAEMHSGFAALRSACPMNLRRSYAGFAPDADVLADLARIEALWASARSLHGAEHGGTGAEPWLFGAYSLADVFFAPVAARVATYGLPLGRAAIS
jgi:glutathione S-transferase